MPLNFSTIPYAPTPPQYLTIWEARTSMTVSHLGGQTRGIDFSLNGVYTDQEILSLIQQASNRIDGFIRDTLMLTYRAEDVQGSNSNFLQLRHRPIFAGLSTTLTATPLVGDTSIAVAETLGFISGQFVQFFNPAIASSLVADTPRVAANYIGPGGPGSIPLDTPLARLHSSGDNVSVLGVDTVALVYPYTQYPLPLSTLNINPLQGQLQLWTPLSIQLSGNHSVFPSGIPMRVYYTTGYPAGLYPSVVKQACREIMTNIGLDYRYEGIRRLRSGERALEYGPPHEEGMPQWIVDALTPYKAGRGMF